MELFNEFKLHFNGQPNPLQGLWQWITCSAAISPVMMVQNLHSHCTLWRYWHKWLEALCAWALHQIRYGGGRGGSRAVWGIGMGIREGRGQLRGGNGESQWHTQKSIPTVYSHSQRLHRLTPIGKSWRGPIGSLWWVKYIVLMSHRPSGPVPPAPTTIDSCTSADKLAEDKIGP